MPDYAKGVAKHGPILVVHEDRGVRISENGQEFGIRILFPHLIEKVRAAFVMDRQHLL